MVLTRDSDGAFATIKALFHPRYFFMYKQAVILLLMLFTASAVPRYLPVICKPSKMLRSGRNWRQDGDGGEYSGRTNHCRGPTAASYYAFNFGFGKGFIDKVISSRFRGDKKLKTVWVTSQAAE